MHIQITEHHVRSVSVMDSLVIANARYAVDHLELDAEQTVDMQSDEAADEPLPITDAEIEIEIATREAIAGVIGKLQAVVDGRFGTEAESPDPKFDRVPVGEKIETGAGEIEDAVDGWDCLADSIGILNCGPDLSLRIIKHRERSLRDFLRGKGTVERKVVGHSGWDCSFLGSRMPFITCRVALAMNDAEFDQYIRDMIRDIGPAKVGEKAAARPLSACEAVEPKPGTEEAFEAATDTASSEARVTEMENAEHSRLAGLIRKRFGRDVHSIGDSWVVLNGRLALHEDLFRSTYALEMGDETSIIHHELNEHFIEVIGLANLIGSTPEQDWTKRS